MVIENPVPKFLEWIGPASKVWGETIGTLLLSCLVIVFLVLLVRSGPKTSFLSCWKFIPQIFTEFFQISFKRVLAIARLIVKESIRKKVIVICVIFLLILMFAGWFFPKTTDPSRWYLSFVLSATTYLVLLLSLFLSALSLPSDFKNKTIFTIVTKPVRSSEIVLGRILGLMFLGTMILLFMVVVSYIFVHAGLAHTHVLEYGDDIKPVATAGESQDNPNLIVGKGTLRLAHWHEHDIEEYADGRIFVSEENGHTHQVEKIVDGDKIRYKVGSEVGTIEAKVPVYGKIKFRDANEVVQTKGTNVGEEWDYRSYVSGASSEAIIWTFDHLSAGQYPDGLPVEMTISVFRTYMGNIEVPVMGSLLIRNPKTGMTAETNVFDTRKYSIKSILIPRTIDRSAVQAQPQPLKEVGEENTFAATAENFELTKDTYDLFEDFVVDGKLEVWLQCIDKGQYIGAAEPDLYIRMKNANVFFNFVKGYFGIWQQMLILISFGVLFSTFLSGPVAMVSTFGMMIAAFCKQLFMQIATMQSLGGGPFESFTRLVTHENLMTELPKNFSTSLIKISDWLTSGLLYVVSNIIPSFSDYNIYMNCVAYGYDVPWNTILVHLLTTLAYVVPLFIAGYLILKNREVAK